MVQTIAERAVAGMKPFFSLLRSTTVRIVSAVLRALWRNPAPEVEQVRPYRAGKHVLQPGSAPIVELNFTFLIAATDTTANLPATDVSSIFQVLGGRCIHHWPT